MRKEYHNFLDIPSKMNVPDYEYTHWYSTGCQWESKYGTLWICGPSFLFYGEKSKIPNKLVGTMVTEHSVRHGTFHRAETLVLDGENCEVIFEKGTCMKGTFYRDSIVSGTVVTRKGIVYRGSFSRDRLHGIGEMQLPNGTKIHANFRRGKRCGYTTLTFPSGNTLSYCGIRAKLTLLISTNKSLDIPLDEINVEKNYEGFMNRGVFRASIGDGGLNIIVRKNGLICVRDAFLYARKGQLHYSGYIIDVDGNQYNGKFVGRRFMFNGTGKLANNGNSQFGKTQFLVYRNGPYIITKQKYINY